MHTIKNPKKNRFFSVLTWLATFVFALQFTGCGGGGGSNDVANPDTGTSRPTVLSGTVLAPDGSTPIAGATVYIPTQTSTSLSIMSGPAVFIFASTACVAPVQASVFTCTEPDGSFELDVSSISGNNATLQVVKGEFSGSFAVALSGQGVLGALSLPSDTELGAPKIAVVTGFYDRMEDILAKLGLGSFDPVTLMLQPGTEKFDIYDGTGEVSPYPDFQVLFSDVDNDGRADINNYKIVFMNCGNRKDEDDGVIPQEEITILRQYVEGGGKLYVTDRAYDFVEQVFPEYIDFVGSANMGAIVPEDINAAEIGQAGIEPNADVTDMLLADWLGLVTCGGSPCLNNDGTVPLTGFLPGWAVMEGAHADGPGAKFWVEAIVEGLTSRPLTVSFNVGLGAVLYTSYHTEDEQPHAGFRSQERILQYLVFEL